MIAQTYICDVCGAKSRFRMRQVKYHKPYAWGKKIQPRYAIEGSDLVSDLCESCNGKLLDFLHPGEVGK